MTSPVGVRGASAAVLLALVGVGAGYASGSLREEAPATFQAAPLPAVNPAYPRDPKLVIRPDPDSPALQRDVATHAVRIGQKPFVLSLQAPLGWVKLVANYGEWRFYPPPGVPTPSNPENYNTYFMRVRLIGNANQTITKALQDRVDALRGATGVEAFSIETVSSDTLIATYVADEHRRVTMERFIGLPSSPTMAYASIAVVGREVDRNGMSSLLEKVTDSAVRGLAGPTSSATP